MCACVCVLCQALGYDSLDRYLYPITGPIPSRMSYSKVWKSYGLITITTKTDCITDRMGGKIA